MNDWKCFGAAARGRMPAVMGAAILAAALGPMPVRVQETGGSIFGWAPVGQTVTVKGVRSGARRHATVKDCGAIRSTGCRWEPTR